MSETSGWITTTRRRQKLGFVFGVAAFVAGLAGTRYLSDAANARFSELFTVTGRNPYGMMDSVLNQFATTVDSWSVANWLYHNAHFVSIDSTFTVADEPITLEFTHAADPLVQLLPVAVLGIAGYQLASRVSTRSSVDAANAGAHVAVGYLAATVASTYALAVSSETVELSGFSATATFSAQPELVSAVAMAGVLFPVAFGALGGHVAYRNSTARTAGSSSSPSGAQVGQQADATGTSDASSQRSGSGVEATQTGDQ